MPRYSIQQRAAMTGKKAQPVVKKPAPAAPKPEAPRMAPEVKSRVEALTTPARAYKEHHVLLRTVSDVLSNGVNDAQEAGMPASKELTGLHARLHQASLHLDAHHAAHSAGKHEKAAGHLNIAADELARVASQLQKHTGSTVRHSDGSEFPLSFVSQIARDATKHYTTEVAGIKSPKDAIERSQFKVKDTHKIGDIEKRMGELSGGAPLRHGTERFIPARPEAPLPSKTHTLERSKYKSAAPRFPARIYGPDQKGA